jgi:hypothetical protein
MRKAGVRRFVEPCGMSAHDARLALDPREVDVLFVDSHRGSRGDLTDWIPLLTPGAITACDASTLSLRSSPLAGGSGFAHPARLDGLIFLTYLGAGRLTSADEQRFEAFRAGLALRHLVRAVLGI